LEHNEDAVRRAIAIRNKAEEKLARGEKLTLSDFDASHSNGRAISEENKQTVRDYWLKNTRMSPNQSDSVFVRNPATGKKVCAVAAMYFGTCQPRRAAFYKRKEVVVGTARRAAPSAGPRCHPQRRTES